jgi:hypothetical protein
MRIVRFSIQEKNSVYMASFLKLNLPSLNKILPPVILGLFALVHNGLALGGPQYVENVPSKNSFPLVQSNSAVTLLVDTNDFPGVIIAANNLQTDLSRVTGIVPAISSDENNPGCGKN